MNSFKIKRVTAAAIAWLGFGMLVAVVGVILTSMIPFCCLGLILAIVGLVTHSILILSGKVVSYWQVALIISVVSSTISIVGGAMAGDHFNVGFILFFLIYYLFFGAILCLLIEKYVFPSIANSNQPKL